MRHISRQAPIYYFCYAVAFLLLAGLSTEWVVSGYEVRPMPLRNYLTSDCEFGDRGPENGPAFRVLDAVYVEGADIMSTLCRGMDLSEGYSEIKLNSGYRDQLDLKELFEARYDLVLAKPELMERGRLARGSVHPYLLIAQYPSYGSQLVTLEGIPVLSRSWLQGRKLGLLDDPNSVSSYQIPMAALRAKGLEAVPEIVYFRSYRQMLEAFYEGHVDVIATILSEEGPDSVLKLPPGFVLAESIPGPAWYLNRKLENTTAHCEVVAGLSRAAEKSHVSYFRRLQIVEACSAG